LNCRFINARRRVVQPSAAAAATDVPADSHKSSAAKHMKSVLQREDRSQFWSHATSVSYTGHTAAAAAAAAVEEAHSLSSTPSSTVSCPSSVSDLE